MVEYYGSGERGNRRRRGQCRRNGSKRESNATLSQRSVNGQPPDNAEMPRLVDLDQDLCSVTRVNIYIYIYIKSITTDHPSSMKSRPREQGRKGGSENLCASHCWHRDLPGAERVECSILRIPRSRFFSEKRYQAGPDGPV